MNFWYFGAMVLLISCEQEKTVQSLCNDMAVSLLQDQREVSPDFLLSCRNSLAILKTQGGEQYQDARKCLENFKTAADLECTSFVERTPEMLCHRLAKTLWRNNQKLNENGFSKCSAMLMSFKESGDDRFERSIDCIENAKTVEDLDCVLKMSEE